MKRHGEMLPYVYMVRKILCSLNTKFNYMVVVIENSKDLEAMNINELNKSLRAYKERINCRKKEQVEHVL